MSSGKKNHLRENSGNLTDEIRETELQIIDRQHRAQVHANRLVRDLRKELASPATLILAGGLGFIIGELTKGPSKKKEGSTASNKRRESESTSFAAAVTPLIKVLGLQNLAPSLYQALPLAVMWIMDTFHPRNAATAHQATRKSPAASVKKPTITPAPVTTRETLH